MVPEQKNKKGVDGRKKKAEEVRKGKEQDI